MHNQLSARVGSQINVSVVHGRMQDLPRGGPTIFFFLGGGGWVACDAWRSHAFARGVWGACFPENLFWNGAIWCVLEHIFIIFLLSKSLKISFLYKNNYKL